MAYTDLIERGDVGGDIPDHVAAELVTAMQRQSVALQLGNIVPTTTRDSKVPVLVEAPEASWVTGDTGLKSVSKADWTPQSLVAEEMAVLVPVSDAVLADSRFPIWTAVKPLLARAAARCLDAAVIFGTNAPATFSPSLVEDATASGNTVQPDADDPAKAVLLAAQLIGQDGYNPSGAAVANGWEFGASAARTGALVANPAGAASPFPLLLGGLGVRTSPPYWETDQAEAVVADWSRVMVGVRQDMAIEVFTSGVIQNAEGAIVLNLIQQDTSVLRMTMRVGYLLAKSLTDSDSLLPSPAAAVVPESPQS